MRLLCADIMAVLWIVLLLYQKSEFQSNDIIFSVRVLQCTLFVGSNIVTETLGLRACIKFSSQCPYFSKFSTGFFHTAALSCVPIFALEAIQLLMHVWTNLVMVNLKQFCYPWDFWRICKERISKMLLWFFFSMPAHLVARNNCEVWGKYFN